MRILYVEDNAIDADLTRRTLNRIAPLIEVEVAGTQAQALHRLEDPGAPAYDVALIDMKLPDGDGLSILAHIRARGLPLAVVIVTGGGDEETAVAVLKAGADDYMVKRADYAEALPITLENALGHFRAESVRHSRRLRVLYVEHTAVDIDLTLRHMARQAAHISFDVARSSEEAMRKLASVGTERPDGEPAYDVALLDYRLPGTNALEMIKELRRGGSLDLPVVLVTGQGHEEIALQALRLGASDYIPKNPGYLFQLPGVLENAWYKTRLMREREALRQSEERFRLLAENAQDIVYRYRYVPQRGFEYVSPAATAITGYTPEEHYADPDLVSKIVHPDDRHILDEAGGKEADRNKAIVLRWVKKDGSIIWAEQRRTHIRDASGALVAVEGIVRDITERRRTEDRLLQAQKMEAVGRLTAGIAHDFNNLLTAINGFTEFAQLKLPPADPVRDLLGKVLEAGKRAAALVHKLLLFSRKETAEAKVIDVNRAVVELEKMLHRVIGEDIELVTRLAPSSGSVLIDPTQLEQVILNLVVNSRDAMPSGGTLTISTARSRYDAAASAQSPDLRPGEYVLLSIDDTGVGMSDDVKSHLFEPFFTTKDVGRGTGLGLATVAGIVKQAGGATLVHSEEGRGTRFTVCLPSCRAETVTAGAGQGAGKAARGKDTILLVEDDQGVRAVAAEMLRSQGYAVIEARSGADALRLLGESPPPIHLLLTDMVMPGMNGRALVEAVLRDRPGMRVLLMSGYAEEASGSPQSPPRNLPLLQKPFTVNSLAAKVREVLDAG